MKKNKCITQYFTPEKKPTTDINNKNYIGMDERESLCNREGHNLDNVTNGDCNLANNFNPGTSGGQAENRHHGGRQSVAPNHSIHVDLDKDP